MVLRYSGTALKELMARFGNFAGKDELPVPS
jgi:hypothetical protein